jgi:hypothetical protein
VSLPYAYESAQWTSAGENLFRLNGNVGIGTSVPDNRFTVMQTTAGNYAGNIATTGVPTGSSYGLVVSAGTDFNDVAFKVRNQATTDLMTVRGKGNVTIGTTLPPFANTTLTVRDDGSTVATAVDGRATGTDGVGVAGVAHNGTSAYGVLGVSSSGYAGYFFGKVHVAGTLSKSAGSFKIDHPLNPANQYLYHSFVESPDMMNIYNGNVALDSKGEAVIALPDWFGALNKDFRYQLTCIGGFAQVYVAEKVKNNRFKIAGGTAGLEVSWQVTGIRQDAYANAHRIPVEEMKTDKERGYYLHPDLFGQPEEKGTEWANHPEMMKEMKEMKERRLQAEKEQNEVR